MAKIKWLYNTINGIFATIWGLTIVDLIAMDMAFLQGIDNAVKTVMALAGLIYFVGKALIELPHKQRMNKLAERQKEIEISKLEKEKGND